MTDIKSRLNQLMREHADENWDGVYCELTISRAAELLETTPQSLGKIVKDMKNIESIDFNDGLGKTLCWDNH